MNGTVEHLYFDFDERTGALRVVASSLRGEPDGHAREDFWFNQLRQYLRLQPAGEEVVPEAFSHLNFSNDNAAVMRRVGHPGDAGRNFAHAIVGSAYDLSEIALSLTTWQGWRERAGSSVIPTPEQVEDLRADCASNWLTAAVRRDDWPAMGLLAAILWSPDRKFSIVGLPREEIVPVLCVVRDVMNIIANASTWSRDWTFSTYETSDSADRENLPDFVFLPKLPRDGTEDGRYRLRYVDGQWLDIGEEHAGFAAEILTRYRRSTTAELIREVGSVVGADRDLESRIKQLRQRWSANVPVFASMPVPASVDRTPKPVPVPKLFAVSTAGSPVDRILTALTAAELVKVAAGNEFRPGRLGILPSLAGTSAFRELVSGGTMRGWRIDGFAALLDFAVGREGEGMAGGVDLAPVLELLWSKDVPRAYAVLLYERVHRQGRGGECDELLKRRWLEENGMWIAATPKGVPPERSRLVHAKPEPVHWKARAQLLIVIVVVFFTALVLGMSLVR